MNMVWPSWTLYTVHMVSCLYSTVQLIIILAKAAYRTPNQWKFCIKIIRIRRWCSHWSQKKFKLNIYVYSVWVKTTEMPLLIQYCPYQNLTESNVPLKLKISATSLSDIFWSNQYWVSYGVFVETCAHTLLGPNVWNSSPCTLVVHLAIWLYCTADQYQAPGWPQ